MTTVPVHYLYFLCRFWNYNHICGDGPGPGQEQANDIARGLFTHFKTIITSVEMDRVLGKSKRMILPEVCIHILKLWSHPWRWTGSWARASEWYCPMFVYTISFLYLIILIFKRFAAVSVFNSSLSKSFCSIKAVLRIRQKDFIHADPDLTHNLKTLLKTSKFIIMYASSTGKVVTET